MPHAAAEAAPTAHDRQHTAAAKLDREADALLFLGRHAAAELLSHRAEALRVGAAALILTET
jgi:hypothetical protein